MVGDNGVWSCIIRRAGFQDNHNDLSQGIPYIGRNSLNSKFTFWSIPLTNKSTKRYHCHIKFNDIKFFDSDDNLITTRSYKFIDGSIGIDSYGFYSRSCLSRNGKGYISEIENLNMYDNVTKIVVGKVDSVTTGYLEPDIKIFLKVINK